MLMVIRMQGLVFVAFMRMVIASFMQLKRVNRLSTSVIQFQFEDNT